MSKMKDMNPSDLPPWQPVILPPPLQAGEIHLWLAQVDETGFLSERMLPLLNLEEQQRAKRYLDRRAQLVFVAARGILRSLLGAYMDCHPREVVFEIGSKGKPHVRYQLDSDWIEFNLAHSSYTCLFGFTRKNPLGVDIEKISSLPAANNLARRFFHPVEIDYLEGLPSSEHLKAFYRIWTLKEAVLKAEGSGLHTPLSDVQVLRADGKVIERIMIPGTDAASTTWELREIITQPSFSAALAVQATPMGTEKFIYVL
jgi:4'-phosphopantetheinyl transferase